LFGGTTIEAISKFAQRVVATGFDGGEYLAYRRNRALVGYCGTRQDRSNVSNSSQIYPGQHGPQDTARSAYNRRDYRDGFATTA
jgi:hypothetical protein